jgi:hypothetical protein
LSVPFAILVGMSPDIAYSTDDKAERKERRT